MLETSKRRDELWHHAGFLLLWSGQTVSQIGSQITQSKTACSVLHHCLVAIKQLQRLF